MYWELVRRKKKRMAEFAVSFLAEKFANLLSEEAVFLHDVRDQVVWIQRELKWMQSFLKDSDTKQERECMKELVADIREAVYDAEDIINTFVLKAASQRGQGFMGFVKRYMCIFKKGILLHEVGKQIENSRTRILEISRRTSTYGVTSISGVGGDEKGASSSSERPQQLWQSYPYASIKDVKVGPAGEIDAMVAELKKDEKRLCVVSIVGMGGLGKTTLARKIYNHSDVKRHFNFRTWVSVSKEYRTKDILEGITKRVSSLTKEELEMMTEDDLKWKVHKLLEKKRYLVVLDDIWDKDAWYSLKNAFPDKDNKSRVLITTRNKDVALHADEETLPHELRFLNKEESWELFCRKVFPKNESPSCLPSLENLGRAMVERCSGLPLALHVLGWLLSRKKKSPPEWETVLKNIHWHLTKSQDGSIITRILDLSCNDLPYHIKLCFMHLGLFPPNWKINVTKLIQYWTVEGIIPQEGEETTESVAENCLNELINRSLIQVVERTKGGRAKVCRIHDLLRDLSVSKAKDENLFEIIDGSLDYETLANSSRRSVIHSKSGFDRYYDATLTSPQQNFTRHLRILIFFDCVSLSKKQMEFICRRLKFLRVLDLRDVGITCLPREIGNLIHLRYLNLNVDDLQSQIPPSIGNLQNLQHLRIYSKSDKPKKIPNVIWKMERLRLLFIHRNLMTSHLRIDTLRNLRSLSWIEANDWIKGGNGSWANLMNIVDLSIQKISSSHVDALFHSFSRLNCLHSLWLKMDDKVTFPMLKPLAICHRLIKLKLDGRIDKLLNPHEFPPNLTKLTLYDSNLKQDSMVMLGNLPNLQILSLNSGSYTGLELFFIANGFPQLLVMELWHLDVLQEWRVEEGALMMLRHLEICECGELRMVPEGLRFMTNLKELVINCVPRELIDKLHGEDSYKIQHISSITIK